MTAGMWPTTSPICARNAGPRSNGKSPSRDRPATRQSDEPARLGQEPVMTLKLYAHPFSSYCQKVLIALYENATPFELRMVGDPQAGAELAALWPLKRFPVLVDEGRTVLEASIIIEHLGLRHPGPVRLIPPHADAALEVRMMDRFFDNYI